MMDTSTIELFANFVSMKENNDIERIVKLDYKGRVLEVLYHIDLRPGYGGLPYFSVIDKNKHFHHFIRGTDGIWHPNGRGPKWPKDFIDLLYDAFEIEYLKIEQEHLSKKLKKDG